MNRIHLEEKLLVGSQPACGARSRLVTQDVREVTCRHYNCVRWMVPRSLNWIQIGPYEWFSFVVGDPEWYPTTDERLVDWNGSGRNLIGLTEAHLTEDGRPCGVGAYWVASKTKPDSALWQLISIDPLHIEPSLLHNRNKGGCGHHGFIRNSVWEDVGRQSA